MIKHFKQYPIILHMKNKNISDKKYTETTITLQ